MHEAIVAAQGGQDQRALELVDSVLQEYPHFAPALKLQGSLLEELGRNVEAAQSYEAALSAAPNDADMLLKVGTISLVTGHVDRAVSLLSRFLRVTPNDAEGNYYLAQAYHLQGDNDRALLAIQAASRAEPHNPDIQQKHGELLCSAGRNQEAVEWLKKAQANDPSLRRIDFDLALASYQEMDLQSAAAYAAQEAVKHPNDLDNLRLLGSVQVKLSEWQDAKETLERLLAMKSDDAVARMELGHADIQLKMYQPAIEQLDRSLQLDPTLVLAHFYLSRAYAGLGDTSEAEHEAALHREMLQHNSFVMTKAEADRENAVLDRVEPLLQAGKDEEAARLLETNPRPGATKGDPWVSIGATYIAMNRTESAERSLQHALMLDPKTRDAHAYLGYLRLQQGDLGGAESQFRMELTLDPNNSAALGELGEVRYRQQRWDEAASLLVRSKTTNPLLLYMLCAAYFQLGKSAEAELTAESLAAYGHNEPAVLKALAELLERNGQSALARKLGGAS